MTRKRPPKPTDPTTAHHNRKGVDPEVLERAFASHLKYTLAKDPLDATLQDEFQAIALVVRDRLVERWIETQRAYHRTKPKRVYYLSLEYLLGRAMENNLLAMGLQAPAHEALEALGLSWEAIREKEADAGLGNGGLGRLAACFLDSLATLQYPATGYGLRYDFGIFEQVIRNGHQEERPDEWLRLGSPWETARPEYTHVVRFGGRVETYQANGRTRYRWVDTQNVQGIPYDIPIVGYGCATVNTLRLWSAKATEAFDLEDFNQGDYAGAVEHKTQAETLTKVLYPADNVHAGKELRFRQEYFFVASSLYDILRRHLADFGSLSNLRDKVAIQLNDTHPALAVPELMRLLMDVHDISWQDAWETTRDVLGYTNHTLMPEALERWPVTMFERLLPRHLDIIYEINRKFLREVSMRHPGDADRLRRMSLIEEKPTRSVRMAHLAVVGSHSVNGVAQLHSRLLRTNLFPEFDEHFPGRFQNKTNGITQRRWLLESNPLLAALITERIGDGWVRNLDLLRELEPAAEEPEFRARFRQIKTANKMRFGDQVLATLGARLNPDSLFDVQVKRIHEYKRQLLNLLHVMMLYFRVKRDPSCDIVPRTVLFAGKAAPSYWIAKRIIKLIHCVAGVVNEDPETRDKLAVHFLPNYGVTLAQKVFPAADLSEQISTAGMEASGTGNMKFALNGALTIGTLDGANIEIQEEVGEENIFIFGCTAEEVAACRAGAYDPRRVYESDEEIRYMLDLAFSDYFSPDEPGLWAPVRKALLEEGDHFCLLADLRAYADSQRQVDALYRDPEAWSRKAILNVARMGKFSSDRTIREYARDIWRIKPLTIDLEHKQALTTVVHRDKGGA